MRAALINSGVVINLIIVADTSYQPPAGLGVVFDPPLDVAVGWTYSEGVFSPPAPGPGDTIEQMRATRILAMKEEAKARLDSTIGSETRELMQDNILSPDLADRIADFSLALRNAVNTAIDQVNAATDQAGVDAAEPVWPVFDGGVLP
jgi:hypothetical protein